MFFFGSSYNITSIRGNSESSPLVRALPLDLEILESLELRLHIGVSVSRSDLGKDFGELGIGDGRVASVERCDEDLIVRFLLSSE